MLTLPILPNSCIKAIPTEVWVYNVKSNHRLNLLSQNKLAACGFSFIYHQLVDLGVLLHSILMSGLVSKKSTLYCVHISVLKGKYLSLE